jgi:PHD/YefM family antitoxin component YafN of YafNO toxin-antitoxin module
MKIRMLKKLRIVMISESEYNSMQETLHLLGSAKNAERLREPIAEFKAANPKKNPAEAGFNVPAP